jgi:Cu-Zn family superoxide dismutase
MRQFAKWATGVFVGVSLALLVAGVVGAFGSDSAHAPKATAKKLLVSATATISGPGGINGRVTFTQAKTGPLSPVQVVAVVQGLPPGQHGFHVHETGTCTPPTFASAGGHFDPGPFGVSALTNHPWHMGDLPNLNATGSIGLAVLVYLHTSRITLDNGPSGLFDGDGSAVVVHANADQYAPNQAGGGRIACGVIQPQ